MRKKRRNIHIIPSLGYGGAESFLLRLIPHLDNENIVITLYHTKYDKKRIRNLNLSYITLDPYKTSYKDILLFIKLLFSLNKGDIIFTWLYISDLIGSLIKLIFFWKNFKLIWNIRNSIIDRKQYSIYAYLSFNLLRKLFMSIPHRILFNSERAMNEHIKKGYSRSKSSVIYNGFESLSKIKNPKNDPKTFEIIYVARYHKQKNYSLLISSISEFKKIYKGPFNLHLVGKNIDLKNKDLIQNLVKFNLLENVILHGLISPKEVHDLFSVSDITLLLSSYGEAFPNVLAEAMLYGTIPIATDVGDAKQIIRNHGKSINKDSTPKEIASLIKEYALLKLNKPIKWKAITNDCANFSENRFKIKNTAEKFNKLSKIL